MRAVVVVVCAVWLAGCGSGDLPTVTPPVPTFSAQPATVSADPAKDAAAQQVDAEIGRAGLHASGFVGDPSTMVVSTCDNMRMPGGYASPAEILDLQVDGQRQALEIFRIAIPVLCPDQAGALREVIEGNIPFGSGTYGVGTERGQVRPGTYRTTTVVDNCYWERTGSDDRILARNTVRHANSVTVSIRATDGGFTNDRCGTWKRVG
jgi:hypothetical protein